MQAIWQHFFHVRKLPTSWLCGDLAHIHRSLNAEALPTFCLSKAEILWSLLSKRGRAACNELPQSHLPFIFLALLGDYPEAFFIASLHSPSPPQDIVAGCKTSQLEV